MPLSDMAKEIARERLLPAELGNAAKDAHLNGSQSSDNWIRARRRAQAQPYFDGFM